MKKFIINNCMNYIRKNTNYDDIKLSEIKYGLEGLYLTVSKTIIISVLAIILGIFKEMIIFMLFYSVLRSVSFGLHATKSWICLISSTILFIGMPYLCIYLSIPINIKIMLGILGICLMMKNSPADTYKKPIVNKKRRKIYKYLSTCLAIIYFVLAIVITNNFLSNCFVLSLIAQNIMISPLTYKIFKLPYNNYIAYIKSHPDLKLD